jgi:Sulfotransferase family
MTLRLPEKAEMQEEINRPIFVVGSPRSGTSILAWCFGHHPNIFPVPESNWIGDFAVNVAVAHQIGSARGRLSILSAMEIPDDEFFAAFGRTINELVVGHRRHFEINRENSNSPSKVDLRWLEATSIVAGPKTHWVDGMPEYSLHICGLRKLFPQARFVHVFRDVEEVVRSMVNFNRATGIQLVANEEEAYEYWLRTVRGCLKGEEAYGPHVVYRLRYSALVENPESALRSSLDLWASRILPNASSRFHSGSIVLMYRRILDPKISQRIPQLWERRGDFPLALRKVRSLVNNHLPQPTSWRPSLGRE